MNKKFLICVFALAVFIRAVFGAEIDITAPEAMTIGDNTPDLNVTFNESVNVSYIWDSAGNISGCKECDSYNTTYGENNGSDAKLNLLFHFNENFSETAFDDSTKGNDGALGNATAGTQPTWTAGKFGPALEFDEVNDFVNVSDSPSLDFTENLTIAAWVYPRFTFWPSPYTGAIGKSVTYALGMGNGKLRLSLYNGSKWSAVNSPDNVSLDQWVHIAGTFNGSWMKLYINGVEVKSQAVLTGWGNSIVTTDYPLQVGYYPGYTYFNGTIDEVAIYNRSLSGAEVQELYVKSLPNGYHCVTVYANDTTGNLNSTKRCFTVSVSVPTSIKVVTNRLVILDDPMVNFVVSTSCGGPNSVGTGYWDSDYWNGEHTTIRAYALVMNESFAKEGVNITFNLSNTTTTINVDSFLTDSSGIANYSFNMNDRGHGTGGTYTITALNSTYSLSSAVTFTYTHFGCANCHGAPSSGQMNDIGWTTDARSPYSINANSQKFRMHENPEITQHENLINREECTYCHTDYGYPTYSGTGWSGVDGGNAYPWGVHSNGTYSSGSGVVCWSCHADANNDYNTPSISSCFDATSCHGNSGYAKNMNLTTFNTLNGTKANYSDTYPATSNPLKGHKSAQNVPCILCHQPTHNISKPGVTPSDAENSTFSNSYTEDFFCKNCHTDRRAHNSQVNCTVCHSQDAHNISFFNGTGNYIKNSSSAGDCTTCHQQTTAWDTLLTQPKAGSYSGSGPPQVPVPLNHSDNTTGQRWGSYWTTGNDLSACNYCHGNTKHSAAALGRPANWKGSNTVNSSINATNNWCAGCHYRLYSSGGDSYSNMTSEFTGDGLSVPPEITSHSSYAPTGTAGYFNHSLGDYSDKTCGYCHDGLAPSATNISSFLHNVGSGKRCENCHFSWSKMDGTFSKPTAFMNETRFTQSVHGTSSVFPSVMFCTSCHTTIQNDTDFHLSIDPGVFTPPQSGWKWCEDCHVVNQTTPVSNRHNLTDNPATNMFNSTASVMDVTDCTTCHNATMYDAAVQSYNKTSGKDCRFCHAFPDLLPGGG